MDSAKLEDLRAAMAADASKLYLVKDVVTRKERNAKREELQRVRSGEFDVELARRLDEAATARVQGDADRRAAIATRRADAEAAISRSVLAVLAADAKADLQLAADATLRAAQLELSRCEADEAVIAAEIALEQRVIQETIQKEVIVDATINTDTDDDVTVEVYQAVGKDAWRVAKVLGIDLIAESISDSGERVTVVDVPLSEFDRLVTLIPEAKEVVK